MHLAYSVAVHLCVIMQEAKQLETLHALEFSLIMIRRKLARIAGTRRQDETIVLHANIVELTAIVDQKRQELGQFNKSSTQGLFQLGESYPARAMKWSYCMLMCPANDNGDLLRLHGDESCIRHSISQSLLQMHFRTSS